MKKLCFVLVLACIAGVADGQIRFGVLGGPHISSAKEDPFTIGYSSKSGLHLGIIGDIPLSQKTSDRWFFQPGLQYTGKGRKFYAHYDSANVMQSDTFFLSSTLAVNYMELPLNIAYKIPIGNRAKFMVSAGPYLGFFFNGKQKFGTKTYSDNAFKGNEVKIEAGSEVGKVNTLDIGVNGRAGFEIGNFFISGFASWGLTNFYHAANGATSRHRIGGGSVGFWFNRTKKQEPTKVAIEIPVAKTEDIQPNEIKVEEPIPLPSAEEIVKGPLLIIDTYRELAEEQLRFAAKRIFFNPNSEQLTKASAEPLNGVSEILQTNPTYRLIIEGHTDASGNAEQNRALSQRRAESVKKYLIGKGVDSSRLVAVGYGSDRPLNSNKTPEGRAANRRVEIVLDQVD